jgi:NADH:ubiquinone oxidoreductase subunit C
MPIEFLLKSLKKNNFLIKNFTLNRTFQLLLHVNFDYNSFLNFQLNFLKTFYLFKTIIDLVGVDWPNKVLRFEIIYNLLNLNQNIRVFLSTFVNEVNSGNYSPIFVNSGMAIYNGLDWLERETWDMFGIFFFNHTDLRRILTDYGFEGFPLRKDFPLTGFLELRYDEEQKSILYENVELSQEFRFFDFESPWKHN